MKARTDNGAQPYVSTIDRIMTAVQIKHDVRVQDKTRRKLFRRWRWRKPCNTTSLWASQRRSCFCSYTLHMKLEICALRSCYQVGAACFKCMTRNGYVWRVKWGFEHWRGGNFASHSIPICLSLLLSSIHWNDGGQRQWIGRKPLMSNVFMALLGWLSQLGWLILIALICQLSDDMYCIPANIIYKRSSF